MPFKRPQELMFAQSMLFGLDHLYFKHTRELSVDDREHCNPLKRPTLFGFVIPDFQRGAVWSRDQQVALIDSVWRAIPIGTYAVNLSYRKGNLPHLRNILIDGQQRLNALRAYWDDEFEYRGHVWSSLSTRDQRFFIAHSFPQMRTETHDEKQARAYYNAMNFGGTAHREEDRA